MGSGSCGDDGMECAPDDASMLLCADAAWGIETARLLVAWPCSGINPGPTFTTAVCERQVLG